MLSGYVRDYFRVVEVARFPEQPEQLSRLPSLTILLAELWGLLPGSVDEKLQFWLCFFLAVYLGTMRFEHVFFEIGLGHGAGLLSNLTAASVGLCLLLWLSIRRETLECLLSDLASNVSESASVSELGVERAFQLKLRLH